MEEKVFQTIADLFKIFGDKTRVKILYCLQEKEQCVDEITESIQMEQSAISHQLRILKDAKLVSVRKEGRFSYYALADEHVNIILQMGYNHATEEI